ncbi:hypothetical protein D3C81_2026860 [compost metagenome]
MTRLLAFSAWATPISAVTETDWPPYLAVIVTLPRATGVTTPLSTVAMEALLVLHSAVGATLVVLPSRSLAVSAMLFTSPKSKTRTVGLAVRV